MLRWFAAETQILSKRQATSSHKQEALSELYARSAKYRFGSYPALRPQASRFEVKDQISVVPAAVRQFQRYAEVVR